MIGTINHDEPRIGDAVVKHLCVVDRHRLITRCGDDERRTFDLGQGGWTCRGRYEVAVKRSSAGSSDTARVAWYGRHGYLVERVEEMSGRSVTQMVKRLTDAAVV